MAITRIREPNTDDTGYDYGRWDNPLGVDVFSAYILGSKHVQGTKFPSVRNDFCGTQGDLIATGSPAIHDFDTTIDAADYYTTPFTLDDLFTAGSGSASIVVVFKPTFANVKLSGSLVSGGGDPSFVDVILLTGTSPDIKCQGQCKDAAGNTAAFNLSIPGSDPTTQYTMALFSFTDTGVRGYIRNSSGIATAAQIPKTPGSAFSAANPFFIGHSPVGSFPGPANQAFVGFLPGDAYSEAASIYGRLQKWFNEPAINFGL